MVSCILPTIRGGYWVINRILELKESKYNNLELVIVEDGPGPSFMSNYNEKAIQYYSKSFKGGIKTIRLEENSGSVSIPRAIGITHSKGEFIAHVDDDVINFPNKFKDLVEAFDKDTSLVYGDMEIVKPGQNTTRNVVKNWNPLQGWGVDGSQFIYRANVYEKMPLVFCRRGCDWETAKEIFKVNPKFKHIDKMVSIYQWHDTNRSLDESTKTKTIYPGNFKQYFNMEGFTANFDPV